MVALETPHYAANRPAPDFSLPATDGKQYTLSDVRGENGLLVMFICNHCPYVQAILPKIIRDVTELKLLGIGAVAIMSNDVTHYPADDFPQMQKLAVSEHFPFPYLIDTTQEVAHAYGAVCTPDFFGYNDQLQEQYRGRLDCSGTRDDPLAERELFHAMAQIAQLGIGPDMQYPSIGCSIKWKGRHHY